MEDVIESTFSLLSFHPKHTPPGTEKALEPAHLLALLDVRATWFKKWMVCFAQRCDCVASLLSLTFLCACLPQHGGYSRTVVLRLLQNKYKSVVSTYLPLAPALLTERSATLKNRLNKSEKSQQL